MPLILQKKSLILSVVFFLLSSAAFLFLYQVVNNNREASTLAFQNWQTEETRRKGVRSLANLIDHIESERAVLDTHFVRSSDIVPFLATIESLAQKVGGKAEVTSVDIPQDDSLLVVELKAGGSFEALYKFVMLLENSPYELLFISANIQNPGIQDLPTSGASEWTATFKINLLSFLD